MKFVLGIIAIVIISLAVYVTMGSNGKQQVQKEVAKAAQPKENVSQVTPVEAKEKKSSIKNITVKSPKVVAKAIHKEIKNNKQIGKIITQEDIDNAGSDEEKQQLIDKMVYHQGLTTEYQPLSEDARLEILMEDLKKHN